MSRYFNHTLNNNNNGMRGGDGPYDIIDVLQIRLDNLERRVDETFKSMQQTLDALIKMSSRGASGIATSAIDLPPPGAAHPTPTPAPSPIPTPTPAPSIIPTPTPTQESQDAPRPKLDPPPKPSTTSTFNPTRAAT